MESVFKVGDKVRFKSPEHNTYGAMYFDGEMTVDELRANGNIGVCYPHRLRYMQVVHPDDIERV
jgi:hypothetical protein